MHPRIAKLLSALLTVVFLTAPALAAGDMIGGRSVRGGDMIGGSTKAVPGDMIGGFGDMIGGLAHHLASLLAGAF